MKDICIRLASVTINNGAIVDKNNNNSIPSVPSFEDVEAAIAATGEEVDEEDTCNATAHRQANVETAIAATGEEVDEEDTCNETAHRQASDALMMNDITVLPIPKENYYACRMETGGSMDLNVSILFRFLVQIFILPRIKRFS
ncbi:unnamed protein product [Trichobilharzia regenti]|nr:unnamed protein product [Trichobilharzia regenti]